MRYFWPVRRQMAAYDEAVSDVQMLLSRPQDVFEISVGDLVAKRNLFDLIQYSKVEGSNFWGGPDFEIRYCD